MVKHHRARVGQVRAVPEVTFDARAGFAHETGLLSGSRDAEWAEAKRYISGQSAIHGTAFHLWEGRRYKIGRVTSGEAGGHPLWEITIRKRRPPFRMTFILIDRPDGSKVWRWVSMFLDHDYRANQRRIR